MYVIFDNENLDSVKALSGEARVFNTEEQAVEYADKNIGDYQILEI